MAPPPLAIPPTLNPAHAALLREHHFEAAGLAAKVLRTDEFDGARVIYAITNPAQTEVVYVGDAEVGRDLRARLKSHMNARDKAGHIEKESLVFVHVMVTEYMVLARFQACLSGCHTRIHRGRAAKYGPDLSVGMFPNSVTRCGSLSG